MSACQIPTVRDQRCWSGSWCLGIVPGRFGAGGVALGKSRQRQNVGIAITFMEWGPSHIYWWVHGREVKGVSWAHCLLPSLLVSASSSILPEATLNSQDYTTAPPPLYTQIVIVPFMTVIVWLISVSMKARMGETLHMFMVCSEHGTSRSV